MPYLTKIIQNYSDKHQCASYLVQKKIIVLKEKKNKQRNKNQLTKTNEQKPKKYPTETNFIKEE